jgi:hypothetical protein
MEPSLMQIFIILVAIICYQFRKDGQCFFWRTAESINIRKGYKQNVINANNMKNKAKTTPSEQFKHRRNKGHFDTTNTYIPIYLLSLHASMSFDLTKKQNNRTGNNQ